MVELREFVISVGILIKGNISLQNDTFRLLISYFIR